MNSGDQPDDLPLQTKRVIVRLPPDLERGLRAEALRLGVTRQALLKVWMAERLDAIGSQSSTATFGNITDI